jgi:hypothetical protein
MGKMTTTSEETKGLAAEMERFRLLSRVFRQMPREFGGRKVEALTAGRWDLLLQRENAFLFDGGEVAPPRPQPEDYEDAESYGAARAAWEEAAREADAGMLYGVCEFLWVHTAPLEEVLEAEEDERLWRREVRRFQMEAAEIGELMEFMLEFREQVLAVSAAMVTVEEDDEEGGEEGPGKHRTSRIGSPRTSSRSGGTKAKSSGGGAFGGSRLRKGSSTCTPQTGRPGDGADGVGSQEEEARRETAPGSNSQD